MSGTSLDGVDIAYCKYFKNNEKWSYKLLCFTTYPFATATKNEIIKLTENPNLTYADFEFELGAVYAKMIISFLSENEIEKDEVDFVACHGQTIYHNPAEGKTIQIGDGKTIATITNIKTINDFRSLDVSLGGQGAPLVPIGDFHFFSDYNYCVNLGGICNITVQNEIEIIAAFDVSPCNLLLNYIANQLGLDYDKEGELARQGKCNNELLAALNAHPYYKKTAPKSLDAREVLRSFLAITNQFELDEKDLLHTICEHIAYQLQQVTHQFNFEKQSSKMLLAGGGTLNTFLLEKIKANVTAEVIHLSKEEVEAKEAIIFGLLGVLKLENEVNCLKVVTGAKQDNCGGVIYNPYF